MSLAGETNPAAYDEARAVCHAIGEFFQIQDDFLDCFGDPEVTGKVGTDIEDSKCTWLVCTALEKADVATEAALREAYIAANATTPDGLAGKTYYTSFDIIFATSFVCNDVAKNAGFLLWYFHAVCVPDASCWNVRELQLLKRFASSSGVLGSSRHTWTTRRRRRRF